MAIAAEGRYPIGYRWRSSTHLIIACIATALFTENFLFSFIVPILDYMLEENLNVDPAKAQYVISLVLSVHALVCVIAGPITGHTADKISSRKGALLVSLSCELVGTVIVAAAPSVAILITGRIILAIGGNAAWIIGLATLADTVGTENAAKTLGAISVIYNSGLLVGPMVSGWLLRLVGYWPTWCTAIAVLIIDMAMRLVIIESPKDQKHATTGKPRSATNGINERSLAENVDVEAAGAGEDSTNSLHETTPLLQPPISNPGELQDPSSQKDALQQDNGTSNFYRIVLSHPRALTAMACHMTSSLVVTSLDTTLPLHVIRDFGWNTTQTSSMFFLIQLPQLALGTFTGWLKDKYGTKVPTGVGYLLTGLLLWLLGTPGKDGLSFIGSGQKGQIIYSSILLALGFARSFTIGTGIIEMTSVIREIQTEEPGIFGPNGGYSRAYSLTNLSWNIGLLTGPLLSGTLVQVVGYYYMNFTFGCSNFLSAHVTIMRTPR
ncbi:MFS transporter, putative [Talaromyces stipitatus ATCC 10500]|uniref:MFS transporter, putative n=1 Tax=Talaromyces stipitatus (strain ATCC 10500 / CBS 375.48 / QM 6759 / NRRL 1006) TaxID=441959 RepID=B8MG41_TALSN|nr:MFS transporter, putative [Talaromyces stipitatus ATCC 10500]EED15908.1 MFS transporter, putative [Talaromyces stipitatus ATCC 10500]